jgi:hypothetical protein
MLVKPNENYKLLGTGIVLDKEKTYTAVLASNQPDYMAREAIFCGHILLDKGEYTIVEASPEPNKDLRPDFDYACECGFYVCNECGYAAYPMEVEDCYDEDDEPSICTECDCGHMISHFSFN